jgi:adenylate kinase
MADVVIVTGLPGAGKTTIVNTIAKDKKYKILNLGDLMIEIALKRGYCKSRDQVRYLPNKKIAELRHIVTKRIGVLKGKIIIDTHASVQQHWRFVPGIPFSMLTDLKHVRGLIYVDAATEAIRARRNKDKTRTREDESQDLVATQRVVNISMLAFCASYLNIPLYIIDNKEGQLEDSERLFKAHLKDAFQ